MLLSLPNEILLVVFSHLQDPYPLYHLSTLCRRLHFLALPIYFSRTGICQSHSDGSCSISIPAEKVDALPALQSSLFLDTVQNLSCNFPDSYARLKDLLRFHYLCSKLSSIESTDLQFSPPAYDDRYPSMLAGYYGHVTQTLNAVLERSCTSLTVDDPSDLNSAFVRISKRTRANPGVTIVGSSTSSNSLSPAAYRQQTLTTFRLHSEILFSPHCSAWTIDVLNSFPLTSLSINVPTVPTDALDSLFRVTEIPTLRDLTILKCRIKPSRMHQFLSRHPSITRLHLGSGNIVPSLEERLPPNHLPQLQDLVASASQVAYLFQAMETTAALRTLRVTTYMTELDLRFTDSSLRTVASRLAPLALSLSLPVPPKLPRFGAPDLSAYRLDLREDSALRLVSTLEFVLPEENIAFLKPADYVLLTKWCDPFPGLRTVEISGFNDDYNMSFILKAFAAHPLWVETLVVNGVAHDLTGMRTVTAVAPGGA
ncbi:hypothetical protein B0H14DRAFT_2728154 [Mycena olivaceomarginata]|nr:hypothetical protein B0H14DRAFT_2728154 [Mycena olivaceomarginata]